MFKMSSLTKNHFIGLADIISGIYKNDVFFGFLGFRDFISDKKSLLRSVLAILGAAFIFAFFLSSDKALIKLTIKERPVTYSSVREIPKPNIEEPLNPNPFEDLEKILPFKKSRITSEVISYGTTSSYRRTPFE
jgi:hypothetical protein